MSRTKVVHLFRKKIPRQSPCRTRWFYSVTTCWASCLSFFICHGRALALSRTTSNRYAKKIRKHSIFIQKNFPNRIFVIFLKMINDFPAFFRKKRKISACASTGVIATQCAILVPAFWKNILKFHSPSVFHCSLLSHHITELHHICGHLRSKSELLFKEVIPQGSFRGTAERNFHIATN